MLGLGLQTVTGVARVSDADRERALRELKRHYVEGRLTIGELEARAEKVNRSVTHFQITTHLRDLPAGGARSSIVRRARRLQSMLLRVHAATYLVANMVLIGVWEVTGKGTFWPALLLVPTTALFASHAAASHMLTRALAHRRT
jgi:hypothetical protein